MPSFPLTNQSCDHLLVYITQHAFKALPSQSYPYRTLLCSQSYITSSGKALVEQHTSPIQIWELKKHTCRKHDKPLVLPLLGWVFSLSCLSASYIPIYTPLVFHLYSSLPISLICPPPVCCSLSHTMDTIHIVPSVEAISERHLGTSVNLPF